MSHWKTVDNFFRSWDGTELFFRSWAPEAESNRAVIVVHRGHEHSGRIAMQVKELGLTDCWAFSWDCRGHGHSPGKRGLAKSYYHLVKDLDAFVHFVSETHGIPIENMVILANSVGAVTTCAWVHDYAPRIRGMVLAAPAFRIRLYMPFSIPLLRLLLRVNPNANISSYVKSKMLTHDREQSASYDADKLITRNISVKVLLGLHDTATRILADAGAIVTPTLLLSAGSDWVVKNSVQHTFFERLSSRNKSMESFPGFFHALLYEKEREKPFALVREFIREAFEHEIELEYLVNADESGYTKDEYDTLRQPLPFWKSLFYGTQKRFLRTIGRMSRGIQIGCETGFDSGTSLDYVYENTARGFPFIGKTVDRWYLDAIGWKGIRERGINLKSCLEAEIIRLAEAGRYVKILDVATGCGRYVLEVMKAHPDLPVQAELRDNTQHNLDTGKALAESLGISGAEFRLGDAFDKASISNTDPRPNIVIVSGLYELFPENDGIKRSLEGIAEVLEEGGCLIYTSQPWHPQIETIAMTCDNREGKPWIMRRRTQAEMDELVRQTGLQKTEMLPDSFGIFSVSVAVKPIFSSESEQH